MRKIYLHAKRLIRKCFLLFVILLVISPFIGIPVFILATCISVLFFSDPIDEEALQKIFSEEELQILTAETIDENVSDDKYLTLLAKYANTICPRKIDYYTTWKGSKVTDQAFINLYEIKKDSGDIDFVNFKTHILNMINKTGVDILRIIHSNRNMIFSYTCRDSSVPIELVISNEELKAL